MGLFSCDGTCGYNDGVRQAVTIIEELLKQGKTVTDAIEYTKSFEKFRYRPAIDHEHVWKRYYKTKCCSICSKWEDEE